MSVCDLDITRKRRKLVVLSTGLVPWTRVCTRRGGPDGFPTSSHTAPVHPRETHTQKERPGTKEDRGDTEGERVHREYDTRRWYEVKKSLRVARSD